MAGSNVVAQLAVAISADTSLAQKGIADLATSLSAFGPLALGAGIVGAAIVGIGVAAVHMAGDFQAGITSLATGAGESQANLQMVSDAILKMATDTGTSTSQLISGMYMIESAGYHGAAGLAVLQAAAEGAKVDNADLGTVADAVTTVMKDYASSGVTAAGATNLLIATVANGKTHMQDLASSMSTVLPAAAAMKLPLDDVMAAMADLTGQGTDAATAATYLRQTFLMLEAPTAAATTALNNVGLTTGQVAAEMQTNLPGAFKMILDHINETYTQGSPQWTAAMKDIVGGTRSMAAILELTSSKGMADFFADQQKITAAVKDGGTAITHWNLVQDTFNLKLSQAAEVGETLMIELGQKLLPVATQLMGFIATNAIPTIQNFTTFITGTSTAAEVLRPILAVVAIAIAGALVIAFIAWAAAAGMAAIATIAATWPILAIGAAIALLVAGMIWAYNNWGWFRDAVQGAQKDMENIVPWVKLVWSYLGDLASAVGNLIGLLGQLKNAIGNALGGAGNAIGNVIGKIPGFATGGTIPDTNTGLALVGENGPEIIQAPNSTVTPLSQLGSNAISGPPSGMSVVPAGASGYANGQPLQITLYVDKTKLGQVAVAAIPGAVRNGTGARAF